jgi:glycosyltransferase involved in cell wall biosynthesis
MLVTLALLTRGRSVMAETALSCALAQTYREIEILVLDDLDAPAFGSLPTGVRYVPCRRMTIGEKRNYAAAIARGEVIAHWDSDDWSHPGRIEHQLALMRQTGAPVVGYNEVAMLDPERRMAWIYRAPSHYAVGSSLMYVKSWWREHRFPPAMVGEDNSFVMAARRVIATQSGIGYLTCRVHSGNTSRKVIDARWEQISWPLR